MAGSPDPCFVRGYRPRKADRVRLTNGRILDVKNGRYLAPGVCIIIRGSKIESMPGLPGEPSGIQPDFTIDLQGRAVVPGLFNTHCHASMVMPSLLAGFRTMRLARRLRNRQIEKNLADCLARGITNIRDAYTDDLRVNRGFKERISRGEIPGPRIRQAVVVGPEGGYLCQRGGLGLRMMRAMMGIPVVDFRAPESGVVAFPPQADECQVRDAVDRAVDERGAEFIKIGEQRENMRNFKPDAAVMSFRQLEALVDQAQLRGLRTTIHSVSAETFRRAVRAGIPSIAHMARDARLTDEDADACLASDCVIEPTASVAYDVSWRIRRDPFSDHPNMERLSAYRDRTIEPLAGEFWIPELQKGVVEGYKRISRGRLRMMGLIDMSRTFRYYARIVEDGVENCRMLYARGAVIGCGNDAGVPPCTPAMVAHELSIMRLFLNGQAEESIVGADAVRIATINSARALGLDAEFGTIETGKTADLAVLDGDPLKDVQLLGSRVAALFMDGRLVVDSCGLAIEPVAAA